MKHHIVAIGISKHKNAAANLAFAERDASEFFTLFQQNIGSIGYKKLLVDQEATLSEIKSALGKDLLASVSAEDVFFFYSGHGALIEDPSDPTSALGFLVPYDATHDVASTGLSIDDLKVVFEALPSRANLIFVDSCFSGVVAKDGKSYPLASTKAFKTRRSFSNTVVGNGSIVFTASKEDELSLEDPEYRHGLFTHYLLEELQRKRSVQDFSAMEIFSPIVSGVVNRAKDRWHHTQTPTFSGKLEGDVTLPVFKTPLSIRPEMIELPRSPQLQNASFTVPHIALGGSEKAALIEKTVDFVVNSSGNTPAVRAELEFERFCHKLGRAIKNDWEDTFQKSGATVDKIPEAVSAIEASCYQLMVVGAAATIFGSERQMELYAHTLVSILDLTRGRSGLTALIAVPEVAVLEAMYITAILCIARNIYRPLEILLHETVDDPDHPESTPARLFQCRYLHYTQALGGYSTKVNEHTREFIRAQDWLAEFAPSIEGKTDDLQLQANFLFSMITENSGDHLWPDYARFYAVRVRPFTRKLVYDARTRENIGKVLGLKEDEVLGKFQEYVRRQRRRGLDEYWWSSVSEADLMTEEEKKTELHPVQPE